MSENSGARSRRIGSAANLVDAPSETRVDSPNGTVESAPSPDTADSYDAASREAVLVDTGLPGWVTLLLAVGYVALGIYCLREAWVTFKEYKSNGNR